MQPGNEAGFQHNEIFVVGVLPQNKNLQTKISHCHVSNVIRENLIHEISM